MASNNNILMIMGRPNNGKTASLRNLKNPQEYVYFNTDLKDLPFPGKFAKDVPIVVATDILDYIAQVEQAPTIKGAVLDTLTFLMSMYERQFVVPAVNTQAAWGAYGNFYRDFIHAIKAGTKDYVIFAHEDSVYNETNMSMDVRVPIKGSVGKVGVEADFCTILAAKQVPIRKLEGMENDLLHITDEEREDEVKYVFCTRVTKDSVGEKMRSAMGLWKRNELYIDNDVQQVLDRMRQYYGR